MFVLSLATVQLFAIITQKQHFSNINDITPFALLEY